METSERYCKYVSAKSVSLVCKNDDWLVNYKIFFTKKEKAQERFDCSPLTIDEYKNILSFEWSTHLFPQSVSRIILISIPSKGPVKKLYLIAVHIALPNQVSVTFCSSLSALSAFLSMPLQTPYPSLLVFNAHVLFVIWVSLPPSYHNIR